MAREALLRTLHASLVPDQRVRDEAERSLVLAEKQPGYGQALAGIALDTQLDPAIRQLSAVLLKRYVRFHWDATAGGAEVEDGAGGDGERETMRTRRRFEPPEVGREEKAALRAALPPLLADPSSKIRTAVAGVIGEMAASDWPEEWPGLLEALVAGLALPPVATPADVARVDGCVRCAAQLAEHFDSEQLPAILQHALEPLFALAAAPALPDATRARALAVVRACVDLLPCLDAPGPLLAPILLRLAPAAAALPAVPLFPGPAAARPPYATVVELLAVVARVLHEFPREAAGHAEGLVSAAAAALAAALPAFEARLAGEEEADEPADPDDPGPDGAVCGLLEVLHVAVEVPRTARAMKPHAPAIAALALAYAQPPPGQAAAWREDAVRYVAEEEDEALDASPRATALALAAELPEAYGAPGLRAVAAAAAALLQRGAERHAAGSRGWWPAREAALAALGLLADRLVAAARKAAKKKGAAPPVDLAALVADTLRLDAAAPEPLLRGRALFAAARLAAGLPPAGVAAVAAAAAAALAEAAAPAVVRLQACRALASLARSMDEATAAGALPGALGALAGLLQGAPEDLLPLLLDATAALLQRAGDALGGAQHGPAIAAALARHLWGGASARGHNPLLMVEAEGALRAMARTPAALAALRGALLPPVVHVLAHPAQFADGPLETALEALEALIGRPGAVAAPLPAAALDAALPALAGLALAASDRTVLQNAAGCLAALVRTVPAELAAWREGATGEGGLPLVARCAGRLLAPGPDDGAAAFAAPLLQGLALHAAGPLGPHLPPLLRAATDRLAAASDHALQQALAVALGRVAAEQPGAVLEAVAAGGVAGPMAAWLEAHAFTLPRSYAHRCSALGLARLLATRDPRLTAALVPADAPAPPDPRSGRLTRSQARAAAAGRPQVALGVRLLATLARALQTAAAGGGEEEEEEEEASSESGGEGSSSGSDGRPAPGGGGPFAEAASYGRLLSDVLADESGSSDGEDAGGAAEAGDPIARLDLRAALAAVARELARDPAFVAAAAGLAPPERAALQAALA